MIQTILITIIIVTLPFWFIVLHKCFIKERQRHKRFLWILFIIFTFTIGTIIYYLVKRRYFHTKVIKKEKKKRR